MSLQSFLFFFLRVCTCFNLVVKVYSQCDGCGMYEPCSNNCGKYDNSLGWICCDTSCCFGPAPAPSPSPPSPSPPTSCPSNYIGDGYCDSECNNQANGYDGGDCCSSTCVSGEYQCGSNGYNCYDCSQDGWVCSTA